MDILRTKEEYFENLPDYDFKPNFIEIENLQIHFVDEGPKNSDTILLMHGEPTWSYLYRHIIKNLISKEKDYRIVAPDLIGFGKSDKPVEKSDHSYTNHIRWMNKWIKTLDLKNITLFCQDWGALIGLRLAIENKERFSRIILANGGLPSGQTKMSNAFYFWRIFSKYSPFLPIGRIVKVGTIREMGEEEIQAYEAPFPERKYKAAPRIFPSLVPVSPNDPEAKNNANAIEAFKSWNKPFLTAFSDKDPITHGGHKFFQKYVPGAKGLNHPTIKNAGHFLQEDKPNEISDVIDDFIRNH